jgi:hypothetical protein
MLRLFCFSTSLCERFKVFLGVLSSVVIPKVGLLNKSRKGTAFEEFKPSGKFESLKVANITRFVTFMPVVVENFVIEYFWEYSASLRDPKSKSRKGTAFEGFKPNGKFESLKVANISCRNVTAFLLFHKLKRASYITHVRITPCGRDPKRGLLNKSKANISCRNVTAFLLFLKLKRASYITHVRITPCGRDPKRGTP